MLALVGPPEAAVEPGAAADRPVTGAAVDLRVIALEAATAVGEPSNEERPPDGSEEGGRGEVGRESVVLDTSALGRAGAEAPVANAADASDGDVELFAPRGERDTLGGCEVCKAPAPRLGGASPTVRAPCEGDRPGRIGDEPALDGRGGTEVGQVPPGAAVTEAADDAAQGGAVAVVKDVAVAVRLEDEVEAAAASGAVAVVVDAAAARGVEEVPGAAGAGGAVATADGSAATLGVEEGAGAAGASDVVAATDGFDAALGLEEGAGAAGAGGAVAAADGFAAALSSEERAGAAAAGGVGANVDGVAAGRGVDDRVRASGGGRGDGGVAPLPRDEPVVANAPARITDARLPLEDARGLFDAARATKVARRSSAAALAAAAAVLGALAALLPDCAIAAGWWGGRGAGSSGGGIRV